MNGYRIIGSTHGGHIHTENQDRIAKREIQVTGLKGRIYLIGVADGITHCDYGASVARWITERHLEADNIFTKNDSQIASSFESYLQSLYSAFQNEFSDMPDMLASGASLSVACIHASTADCFWAGDSPIYFSEKGTTGYETKRISTPDKDSSGFLIDCFGSHAPFQLKHKQMNMTEGAIITITSDGSVHDEMLLSHMYECNEFSDQVVREVIDTALRNPHSDDVSIVACQRRR